MLLGGVFKATGNHSPVEIPAKGKWLHQDLQRWAKRYGAVFRNNPHFPVNTLVLMRGATGLQMRGTDFDKYVEAMFRAMWEAPRNLGDPAEIAAVLRQAGFDAEAFLALVNDRGGERAAQEEYRGGGGARRVRRTDFLCRRRNVLGPGPARFRRRSAGRLAEACSRKVNRPNAVFVN